MNRCEHWTYRGREKKKPVLFHISYFDFNILFCRFPLLLWIPDFSFQGRSGTFAFYPDFFLIYFSYCISFYFFTFYIFLLFLLYLLLLFSCYFFLLCLTFSYFVSTSIVNNLITFKSGPKLFQFNALKSLILVDNSWHNFRLWRIHFMTFTLECICICNEKHDFKILR